MDWSNEDALEFLDAYKAEPVIWNKFHVNNKNRHEVYEAWKRIQDRMSHRGFATIIDLKKKKECLMATFRVLQNKASERAKNGEVYKPTWFAYEKMDGFLMPRRPQKTRKIQAPPADRVNSNPTNSGNYSPTETNINVSEPPTNTSNESHNPRKRKSPPDDVILEQRMRENYYRTSSTARKPNPQPQVTDELDIYAQLLACKLRRLDEKTRDIVMNQIDNLMFQAKMGNTATHSMTQFHNSRTFSPPSTSQYAETSNFVQDNESRDSDDVYDDPLLTNEPGAETEDVKVFA